MKISTMQTHSTRLSRVHQRTWNLVASHPALYYPLARLRTANRVLVVRRDTEIVIEGFPRSANTFAVVAFQQAQRREVRIAHHLHAPAQVIRGVRFNKPVIVLFRDPLEAVGSLLIRHPHVDARLALERYIAFYRRIFPLRQGVVAVGFDEVTTDMRAVIRRTNKRYGTNFVVNDYRPDSHVDVFAEIDRIHARAARHPEQISRPSSVKQAHKRNVEDLLCSSNLSQVLKEAQTWCDRYQSLARE